MRISARNPIIVHRVCGYALTNAAGRGVSIAIAYDGSYPTNMSYALPDGGVFSVKLTRKQSRRELVTRRDYAFDGLPVYFYAADYDLLNRPTNATDSVSVAREWLYNRRSELAAAAVGTNFYGYAYDTIGNRLWSAANSETNSYAANSLNQYTSVLRASDSPCEISHDSDGNMTSAGSFSYSYDAENRLVSVYPTAPNLGAFAVENRYDHRHRRIRKIVKTFDGEAWEIARTHTFVWDGNNIVLERIANVNGITRTIEYFWGADKSGSEQGAGGVEGLLAVSIDGVFNIPCYDHNGNIVLYVSETGGIAAQYVYDPYGNVIESSCSLADVFSFGFSTQYHDRETGMVGYKRRFYRPDLGRWLNRDPIEEEGGENLYLFCANIPSAYYDVYGFSWEIKRDGGLFATARATSSADTFQDLASKIRLDVSDYKLWAHTEDASPDTCKKYKIPNLIVYDNGRRKFINRLPFNIISAWQRQNEARANADRASGFMVRFRTDVSSDQIEMSLSTDGLYRYTFSGHGDGETGINSYPDPFDTVDPIVRYTRYGINSLTLQACGSAAINEYDDNRIKGLVRRNSWECNVATVGFFVGYEGSVTLLNEVFQWTIVRGTNNRR